MIFEDLPGTQVSIKSQRYSRTPHTEILHHNLVAICYSLLLCEQCISIFVYCLLVNIEDCDSIKVRNPGRLSDYLLSIFNGCCCGNLNRLWKFLDRFLASYDFVNA
jgi:hypothetical protein